MQAWGVGEETGNKPKSTLTRTGNQMEPGGNLRAKESRSRKTARKPPGSHRARRRDEEQSQGGGRQPKQPETWAGSASTQEGSWEEEELSFGSQVPCQAWAPPAGAGLAPHEDADFSRSGRGPGVGEDSSCSRLWEARDPVAPTSMFFPPLLLLPTAALSLSLSPPFFSFSVRPDLPLLFLRG